MNKIDFLPVGFEGGEVTAKDIAEFYGIPLHVDEQGRGYVVPDDIPADHNLFDVFQFLHDKKVAGGKA